MIKSVEITNGIVTNIAVGEVENWVQVSNAVTVNIGDTATQTGKRWTFTPPVVPDMRTYKEKRQQAYPEIGEQLDAIWHAMDMGTTPKIEPWYSQIKAVKTKYPKT